MKNYYLSHQISYSWNDAFFSCQSAGLKLATIESKLESQNLFQISKKKVSNREVHIDGKDLVADQEESSCLAFNGFG